MNRFFSKWPFGASFMICGALSSNRKAKFIEMKGKQDAMKYTEILENSLLPFIQFHEQNKVIFQLDNAAIHTAKHIKIWFTSQNINVLDWQAKSLSLIPLKICGASYQGFIIKMEDSLTIRTH